MRARICLDWAAGWTLLNSAFMRMMGRLRMSSRPMARWCGVGRGVVAVVADEVAHVGPVLLLDLGAVVAMARTRSREGDLVVHVVVEQVVINELSRDAKDRERPTWMRASNTHFSALFCTDRSTVHPVPMSVTVRVKQNSPDAFPPSCPTKSISTKPGTASSQSAQVRIGIYDFSNVQGLV